MRLGLRSLFVFVALAGTTLHAGEKSVPKGQRVLSAGHSFHYFMPPILKGVANSAGIADHEFVGLSSIGGSRVIQHWNVADEKNIAKNALKTGKVDVLTLAPIHLPDEGIANFTKLALEHNPKIRVTVQEFWLPFDIYDTTFKERPAKVDHNAITIEELKKRHAPYFKSMDDFVVDMNKKLEKDVLFVVPVGQAVLALREKIVAGQAPGLKVQEDLFTDAIGHAKMPIQVLNTYCHYAVIYGKSPVGLKVPDRMSNYPPELNTLLQQLAWEAVTSHPLTGVKK